jgi:hypothetical protein
LKPGGKIDQEMGKAVTTRIVHFREGIGIAGFRPRRGMFAQ